MDTPDVSVIIETDNLRSADEDRAHKMLAELAVQTREIDKSFEVLLVYDDAQFEESFVAEAVARSGLPDVANVRVDLHPARGLRYYEIKNEGVRHTTGDIVVFVDSDVIPEPGWLAGIVEPFDDPSVEVVRGTTYLGPCRSTVEKTYALIWIFPLRSSGGALTPSDHFHAGNVAFRRTVLERHPFRGDEDTYRGQCSELARTLREEGHTIWLNPDARLAHPTPPPGLVPMVERALWHGHDRAVASGTTHTKGASGYGGSSSLRVLGSMVKQPIQRILTHRREVELPLGALPLALAVGTGYNLAKWLGFAVTRTSRRFLHQWVPRP